MLSAYREHLDARWSEGCRSALQLFKEIQALGFTGSSRQVSRWVQQRRTEPHPCTPAKHRAHCLTKHEAPKPGDRLPSTRRLAWILVLDPEALSPAEAAALVYVCQDAEVALLHDLSRTYRRMVREKRPEDFDEWLSACTESGISPMKTFAKGLQQDYAAVHAALKEPWSSGQAEGQTGRLKTLKRMMYGRAGFALLRKRILYTA